MANKKRKRHKKIGKNPLIRRIPREISGDWRKYFVVSLFLILTIGFVSGMYVANESMMKAAEEGKSKYRLEDGHFELKQKAEEEQLLQLSSDALDLEAVPVRIYENFYRNEEEDNNNDGRADGTVRVYAKTEEVNLACLMEGRYPSTEEEIAIDRMHADNAGMRVGDTITVGGQRFLVVGFIAYVNYATLHEKNTDLVFDALKFDVAMVTEEGFRRLGKTIHYSYAWHYEDELADEKEEKKLSDHFLGDLFAWAAGTGNEIVDYIPRYANQAIRFATDDMGSDEAMGGVLLNILIGIIAFIFAISISSTITKESQVIGTLRASGYTRGEMARHYLLVPVVVTLASAAIGNILGYSLFKNIVVSMYYNSYSLPAYETVWNFDAFLRTTLLPSALMLFINLAMIAKMMRHTPLQFLRQDLKKTKRKKAVPLPKWKFFGRFRMRIMLQNIPNYGILFFGIFFVMVMLAMAVGMPDTLRFYKENAADMMFAKYQYVLNSCQDAEGNVLTTENGEAEEFAMRPLQKEGKLLTEEVSVYGIAEESRYVRIAGLESLREGEIYISAAFQDKYHLMAGDTIILEERYEEKQYEFQILGVYDRCQSIAVFMPIHNYRLLFGLGETEFGGYMSDSEIKDIEERYIAAIITERDITKMCDQLDHSMGSYMQYFQVLCILLSAVMIYLLTKIIIEKNEKAISMAKILGYSNWEIASLYLFSTTIILVISDIISVALGVLVMEQAWRAMMSRYSGWFAFVVGSAGYVKMFAFVLAGYLMVILFDFRRIKKIPMEEVLKNVE